ncbi:hypothetical protein [Actinacidiphila glaucinigra]
MVAAESLSWRAWTQKTPWSDLNEDQYVSLSVVVSMIQTHRGVALGSRHILTAAVTPAGVYKKRLCLTFGVLDGDGGVLGPAFAQVLAVGVDEAGSVAR